LPDSSGRLLLICGVWWLCWTPALASATSVAGEVYDVRTGTVVPGATVTLGGEAATAGSDGIFKLIAAPREPSYIVATAPGYAVTVVEYLPAVPAPREIWRNVPLMPKAAKGARDGDFVDLFFKNAPLDKLREDYIAARRFDGLPLRVEVVGAGPDREADVSRMVELLNERWGLSILEPSGGEETSIKLDFAPEGWAVAFGCSDGIPAASLPGGATAHNLGLAEAFLRRVVLAGKLEGVDVTAEGLRADTAVAEDLDAVVEIIYREPADFNYAVFKKRPPARFSILTDLYLGIGGYERHGVLDGEGRPVEFPAKYQLGQITVAGGGSYRDVWAKAGFWFGGIWDVNAEELVVVGGSRAEKVLQRDFSTYYRGGYWFHPLSSVRVGPVAGYRTLSVRGKFKGSEDPAGLNAPLDIDYTTRYDGIEAGFSGDLAFRWYNLGLFGEFARVFADRPFNLAEFGFGAASHVGVGTFAYVRFYWGQPLRYTFGGLAMKLAIPL
jgi:hypothetical protein